MEHERESLGRAECIQHDLQRDPDRVLQQRFAFGIGPNRRVVDDRLRQEAVERPFVTGGARWHAFDGVQQADAGLKVKLVYWFMRKGMSKITGRAPAAGRSGIEPIEVWAHQPKLLSGMGKFQQAVRKAHTRDREARASC